MNKKYTILVIIIVAAIGLWLWGSRRTSNTTSVNNATNQQPRGQEVHNMQILSAAFGAGQAIPAKYTCDGDNTNPPLTFGEVPDQTQSLALIVDDPDAPNGTWTHWTLWNISASTTAIAENLLPSGAVVGQTSFGSQGYGGPCPPAGQQHRYFFKLYALDAKLTIPSYSDVKALTDAMDGHILQEAELMGV